MRRVIAAFLICTAIVFIHSSAVSYWVYKETRLLPNIGVKMKTAGFWIGLHPSPDKTVMSHQEIAKWNASLIEKGLVKKITEYPASEPGEKLMKTLVWTWNDMTNRGPFLDKNLKKLDIAYFISLKTKMNLSAIPATNTVRYGIIVKYASQRSLPLSEPLYDSPYKTDFDRNLVNHLDIGTPVAIRHVSADGLWFFIASPLTAGWVEAGDIAVCTVQEMKDFTDYPSFMITAAVKSDVFLDPGMSKFYTVLRMGVKLPMSKKQPDGPLKIVLPIRDESGKIKWGVGYIKHSCVSKGYLPYTPRTIYELAFKLLYSPYGWMGSMGYFDCSDFIRSVFSCTGLLLPRYSYYQITTGQDIAFPASMTEKDRLSLLMKKGVGGITLIRTHGHILLYLGAVNNTPYVMHDTWGWYDKEENLHQIAGVTISDLSLNKDSTNKSLALQMEAMTLIRLQ
ncbi:MAG: hypothetical protein A2Y33_10310 [Spirochaetes bacterium GWF1_51_8]|nr:MAG: hypothetical protein A2Y33_10310 [Spirochaetes bacterium GWF1_51_8]